LTAHSPRVCKHGLRSCMSVLAVVSLLASSTANPHDVLEPEAARMSLAEILRYDRASREGEDREAKAEALFRLGETVQNLVDMMNQDYAAHPDNAGVSRVIVTRLAMLNVRVAFVEATKRYTYDLAAFREYLKQVPRGKHAPEARFRLIAQQFHDTQGADHVKLFNTDVEGLAGAVAEEEKFLKDYPQDARTREVRFFLGADYFRLSQNIGDAAKAARYQALAMRTLERVEALYPDTIEARGASMLLERLRQRPGSNSSLRVP
jgi:hypothetical protein